MTVNPKTSNVNNKSQDKIDDILLTFVNAGRWESPYILNLSTPAFKEWYFPRKTDLINAVSEQVTQKLISELVAKLEQIDDIEQLKEWITMIKAQYPTINSEVSNAK